MTNLWLTFSDSAKYAEAGLNLSQGLGAYIHHAFFNPNLLQNFKPGTVFIADFPPLTPYLLSFVFRLFPATDLTIITFGYLLYIFTAVLLFFLAKKLFSTKVGLLAITLFIFNTFFWQYAGNSSTEIIFSLLLVIFYLFYFLSSKYKYLSIISLILLFLTRQQGLLFAASIAITEILISRHRKKYIVFSFLGLLLLSILTSKFHTSPISPSSIMGSINISPDVPQGIYLRGTYFTVFNNRQIISKIFYNLYNFAKAPERIINPLILVFAIFGLIANYRHPIRGRFFLLTFISTFIFILGASATLPNARYIHPLVPLLIICGSVSLWEIGQKLKKLGLVFIITVVSIIILPSVGFLTVDARFRTRQFNAAMPPVYKVISDVMADNLPKGELIVTNLDAWAAWYYDLTTMWFPLQPEMLAINPPKYIVITNYLENDADFALGPWREVVYTPDNIQNAFLTQHYQVYKTFTIQSDQVYEKQTYKGTILVRKP